MYKRILELDLSKSETCFMWGARQTGKSTLLKQLYPKSKYYDLLLSDVYERLLRRPSIFREECIAHGKTVNPIIIDEVQKIPALLDEVHWLIENEGLHFILCGSSARKLKRGHGNLLGGRAIRYELYPLVYQEINNFSLEKALNGGLIPRHYNHSNPRRLLQSYVGDYLKEEILSEALTRNISSFHRFLEIAAIGNGEIIKYQNIASDVGVSSPTVKEYYQILSDTLLGNFLPAYRLRAKRRTILAPKFFLFDIGVAGYLTNRGNVEAGSELFGKTFEHFLFNEIKAHSSYSEKFYPISYWRTSSGFEVDFILGEHEIAIEIKSTTAVQDKHLKGLRAFSEEFKTNKRIVVSCDANERVTSDGIQIIPWKQFLEKLWSGDII